MSGQTEKEKLDLKYSASKTLVWSSRRDRLVMVLMAAIVIVLTVLLLNRLGAPLP
jgi:hypothetical protein